MLGINNRKIYLLAVIILLSSACDRSLMQLNYRKKTFSERKMLESRVNDFMQFSRVSDYRSIYNLLIPEYQAKVNFSDFKDRFSLPTIGLVSYYIESIEIEKDSALVLVSEFIKPIGIPSFFLYNDVKLIWKNVNGEWLFDLEKTMNLRNAYRSGSSGACGASKKHGKHKNSSTCGS